jgi:hypothetical protein
MRLGFAGDLKKTGAAGAKFAPAARDNQPFQTATTGRGLMGVSEPLR